MHVFAVVLKKFLESTLFLRVPYVARTSQQLLQKKSSVMSKFGILVEMQLEQNQLSQF